ncbi:MAG: ATP-dependent DNA helicase RecG [Bifidobacteriaceae bacterium]|jgi:ATP-dependent DNA helicase RecG|nr:ATP-dependent DNA helicase RecG [Bifidobacteriaceae bacterium]
MTVILAQLAPARLNTLPFERPGGEPRAGRGGEMTLSVRRYSLAGVHVPATGPPEPSQAPADAFLDSRIDRLIGRGSKKLVDAGIKTVGDLLRHYPKRYDDPRVPTDMSGLRLDEMVSINAQVAEVAVRDIKQRTQWLVAVTITDGTRQLALAFFLKKWHLVDFYTQQYRVGRMGLFTGKVSLYRGRQQLVHPEVVWDDALADPDPRFEGKLIPIYPAIAGIQSPLLQKAIQTALKALGDEQPSDPLPRTVREDRHLPALGQSFWSVHSPANPAEWRAALDRFRFEEAFILQTGLARRRHQLETGASARPRVTLDSADALVARLDEALPFDLTSAQRQAGDKLSRLLALDRPMNQLLQGDVGSGKTVVALRAMLQVVDSAGQAALLAPTEVLAAQHYRTIEELLGRMGPAEARPAVRLLTGALAPKARVSLLNEIEMGEAQIVIGTHALLEDSVKFHDLGLVVVDEQHRFGVEQRDALRARSGSRPHLLVMTATPIPRTVAMTVFGDLGTTVLGEAPPGRPDVVTTWVNPLEHPAWLGRVWARLAEEVAAGRRGFVVCPAIEPGEPESGADLFAEDAAGLGQLAFAPPRTAGAAGPGPAAKRPLAAVSQTLERLRADPALAGVRLAAMHGRMSSQDKDQTMAAFGRGELDVLVATTVIEVGIDIPAASALIVLDADRFGLSQLHQLRGRIGRGQDPGICLLVSSAEPDTVAARRLTAMEQTRDGFALAEVDLQTRREGEILGEAQSGRSSLKLVRLARDHQVIDESRRAAGEIISQDPGLAGHPALKRAVDGLLAGREEFLERG